MGSLSGSPAGAWALGLALAAASVASPALAADSLQAVQHGANEIADLSALVIPGACAHTQCMHAWGDACSSPGQWHQCVGRVVLAHPCVRPMRAPCGCRACLVVQASSATPPSARASSQASCSSSSPR
jgi:hypothetical protein